MKLNELLQESIWDKLNKLVVKHFNEFGVGTLESDDLATVIDIKAADKIAQNKHAEYGFATIDEDEMKEIINANPSLIMPKFRKLLNL